MVFTVLLLVFLSAFLVRLLSNLMIRRKNTVLLNRGDYESSFESSKLRDKGTSLGLISEGFDKTGNVFKDIDDEDDFLSRDMNPAYSHEITNIHHDLDPAYSHEITNIHHDLDPTYSNEITNIHHDLDPAYSFEASNVFHNTDPAFSFEPSNLFHDDHSSLSDSFSSSTSSFDDHGF